MFSLWLAILLTVTGTTSGSRNLIALKWSGISGTYVDVYRDGVRVSVQANDGKWIDNRVHIGLVTYTYRVCQRGSVFVCSKAVKIATGTLIVRTVVKPGTATIRVGVRRQMCAYVLCRDGKYRMTVDPTTNSECYRMYLYFPASQRL